MDAISTLAARYAKSHPGQAARRLETVPSADFALFLAELEPETAVAVIESTLPSTVAAAFETIDREALSTILAHLPVARCVLVMRSVEKSRQTAMMGLLPQPNAIKVERLVRSSKGSAGVLAEPVSGVLSPDMSIEEARDADDKSSEPYLYVVDTGHRLLGVMHCKELAKSDRRARVGNLMSRQVVKLPSAAPHSAVRGHRAWIDYDMLPVVDSSGVLVGVIRHKNIRRTGHTLQAGTTAHRSTLATFLDLGEIYWSSLSTVLTAMAGAHAGRVGGGKK